MRIGNRVRETREKLGIAQRALAEQIGLSRQSLSAIENGSTDPSVGIALRIARALGRKVDELFASPGDEAPSLRLDLAEAPFDARTARVVIAQIDGRWVGHRLSGEESVHACDGVLDVTSAGHRVRLLGPEADVPDTVSLAGCAPALAVLADRTAWTRGGPRAVWLDRGNARALDLLRAGHVSFAGVHGQDDRIARQLEGDEWVLVSLARWQAGLVVTAGNPLAIRDAADLARSDVRVVAREQGSGARALLEKELLRAGVVGHPVIARALSVHSHLAVGRAVALGAADVGMAIEPIAVALGLGFIAIAEERFDLVLARSTLGRSSVQRVLDVLASGAFRADVAALGGYDVRASGDLVALPGTSTLAGG